MDSKSNERSSSGASVVTVILLIGMLLLPIAYVLSIGPAVWLYDRGWLPDAVIVVYWPIEALHNYSSICREALDWYVALWQ